MAEEAWGRWGSDDECGALNHIGGTGSPLVPLAVL